MFDGCSGKVGLHEYYACTHFDYGISCLFVSATFACLSKLAMKLLLSSLGVALPMRDVILCSRIASRYLHVLCRHVLEVDLVDFNLLEFDIILDMDWLSQHYACIGWFSQAVSFQSPKGEMVEFLKAKLHFKLAIISAMQEGFGLWCRGFLGIVNG